MVPATSYCCSLASVYPMGDVRRQFWNQGTKEQPFLVMVQVWLHVAPTSERIIEDLEHLPDVVKKNIAHGGAAERTLLGTGGDIGGDGDAGAAMDAGEN